MDKLHGSRPFALLPVLLLWSGATPSLAEERFTQRLNMQVPHIREDVSINLDYPIVYVRAPRFGDTTNSRWAEVGDPTQAGPGADLVVLYPDGKEDVLVVGGDGSVADPTVSFDGEWVYYSKFHNLKVGFAPWGGLPVHGADIYKIHVKTRKIVQLTHQQFTPNLGAADWNEKFGGSPKGKDHIAYGVLNLGPCPLPGGRLAFVSNRNGFRPPKFGRPTLQLFVMDEDGGNLEQIGHLNISQALHPVVLVDGRIMFSSFENQGLRSSDSWGLWTIHPDGTNWGPLISAFEFAGIGANNSFHFQTQLSDESIVLESYYINNNNGFGDVSQVSAAGRRAAMRPLGRPISRSAEPAAADGPALQRRADAHALPV